MQHCSTHLVPTAELAWNRFGIAPTEPINLWSGVKNLWANDPVTPGEDAGETFAGGGPEMDMSAFGIGGPTMDSTPGVCKFTNCLLLDRTKFQYLTRADEADLRYLGGDICFTVWVYITDLSQPVIPIFAKNQGGNFEFRLAATNARRFLWQFCATPTTGQIYQCVGASGSVQANTWYHLCAFYNELENRAGLIVNGSAPIMSGPVGAGTPGGTPFRIGADDLYFYSGRIEQLIRWRRIPNLSERNALLGASISTLAGGGDFYPASGGSFPGWTDPLAAPAAPSDLSFDMSGASPVLQWTVNAANSTEQQVERSVDGGAYTLVARVMEWGGGSTTWTDTNTNPALHVYAWRVRSVTPFGSSGYSNEASTVIAEGTGYIFDSTPTFYLFNADQSGFHDLSIVGESLAIGAGVGVGGYAASAFAAGTNYEFSTDMRFRLKDDTGAFRELWAESGSLVFDSPGTASAPAIAAGTPGRFYKFENGEFYLYDIIDLVWRQARIVGSAGLEQLQLT